jgi:hypothetical protein
MGLRPEVRLLICLTVASLAVGSDSFTGTEVRICQSNKRVEREKKKKKKISIVAHMIAHMVDGGYLCGSSREVAVVAVYCFCFPKLALTRSGRRARG